jgi:hypothetical protein
VRGVNWNDYPPFFKRGTFFQARTTERKFTEEEILELPEKHRLGMASMTVKKRDVVKIDMPPFTKVVNRVAVVFDGAEPKVENE